MIGPTFWAVLAVVAVLCLVSIRAQLRRLVRLLDIAIRLSQPFQAASRPADRPTPGSGKP